MKLLPQKVSRLEALLRPFNPPRLEVFPAPESAYRMRAEFAMLQRDGALHYSMFEAGKRLMIQSFPRATPAIQNLMPRLLSALNEDEILSKRLFQVEFHSSSLGEMMLTLIYHRPLDDAWEAAALKLQEALQINVIGRSRGQKIVLKQDFVCECFRVQGRDYLYHQYESAFSQPNAAICAIMLNWVAAQCQKSQTHDLLELYCGNGNFTLPLSACFRRVLATEISKTSVKALAENCQLNRIQNIDLARLSAAEIRKAWQGVRPFRRLQQAGIDLSAYRIDTVLIDPPRAGVDDETLAWLQQFRRIIYVSCNPETLAANAQQISTSHRITQAALFDQFPDTPHIEAGTVWEAL